MALPDSDQYLDLRMYDQMRFGLKLTAWIIGVGGLLALADSISTKRAEPAGVAIIALLVSVFLFLFVWAFLRNPLGKPDD